ncbi:hypothetical protein VNI00_003648 [Paramarasmius palmivorus]|uniref:DUF6533 domain-containing protein n=1 Tax=Paramarasmius palmivorus TaxID=297713 RepID=A0AAW0DTP0_9AGAR
MFGNNDSVIRAAPIPTPEEVAAGSQAVNRSSVAALAFLLYDICLTFEDEVDLFWPRKWSLMKINFFFVRYFPLFAQAPLLLVGSELTERFHFSSHDCFIWQVYQGVISVLTIMSCDFVLLARIYALYYTHPRIRKLVSICYVFEIIFMCVGLGLALPGVRFDEICVVTDVPTGLLVYAGATIILQTLLFGLTLYKFIVSVRAGWGNVPITGMEAYAVLESNSIARWRIGFVWAPESFLCWRIIWLDVNFVFILRIPDHVEYQPFDEATTSYGYQWHGIEQYAVY